MRPPILRVRFAPSPTGDLHVGNARTALLNWLYARRHSGTFVLRVEDTDQERTTKAFEANLIEDLHWLGIDWDEGPGKGGIYGPYHQIERLGLYRQCLETLIAAGHVYPCYCTEAELEAERAALVARRQMPRYLGRCRKLSEAEQRRLAGEGRRPVWRFRVPEGPIGFIDLIRGPMAFRGEAIGDFVIVRSNGIPAYNFACVCDDHAMAISHVIRGEDHLSNTAMQVLLYQALGYSLPHFAHHALVLGKDHTKLSKRHGSVAVREFRNRGILPEVLIQTLALLGTAFEGGKDDRSIQELAAGFTLERTGRGGAVFDEEKLLWLNGMAIRRCKPAVLTGLLRPFIRAYGYEEQDWAQDRLEGIVAAVQDNLTTLADIGEFLDLFQDDRYTLAPEAREVLRNDEARRVVVALQDFLQSGARSDEEGEALRPEGREFPLVMKALAERTALHGKKLYLPIRAALTGRLYGPELDKVFALLGPHSTLKRVGKALDVQ